MIRFRGLYICLFLLRLADVGHAHIVLLDNVFGGGNNGGKSHFFGGKYGFFGGGGKIDYQAQPPSGGYGDEVGGQGDGKPLESQSMGEWELFSKDSGVSAMHIQIMPNNNAIIFDATSLGPSNIKLVPNNCRFIPPNVTDCFAHGVVFDTETDKVPRALKVMSDTWCSSGGLAPDGILINTGGWADGERSIRYIEDCPTCDFRESPTKLSDMRWYGTQVQLSGGQYLVIGGRRAFNYEFVAPEGKPSPGKIDLPFLKETTDIFENNLYPFVHLAPNGNLFMLANFKAIMLDPIKNKIIRKYPDLPGGARNYPSSGSSALLPIKLKPGQKDVPDIEVLVCGGGQPLAFGKAEKENAYLPALDTCGRMKFMEPNAKWEMDTMPSPRIMGDMLNLPNGQILMINGAQKGAAGWTFADDPNFTPVLYTPFNPRGQRFKSLAPTNIARMYHSSSAVLQSGKILVAGSNTNPNYQFHAKFPTEVRVEKFSPPYLDQEMDQYRPEINTVLAPKKVGYGKDIVIPFQSSQTSTQAQDMTVALYKPPFTTHGFSMNQRLVELAVTRVTPGKPGEQTVAAQAPVKGELAPPGYYLLFLSYRGVPGKGSWIHLI